MSFNALSLYSVALEFTLSRKIRVASYPLS